MMDIKPDKILLIFDFDGVLVNSIKVMEIAWKNVTKKLKINKPFSKYRKFIGLPFNKILENLQINKNQKLIYNIFHKTSLQNKNLIKPYNGVLKNLNLLKKYGYKLAIVTSKSKSRVIPIKKKFKFPISNIVCHSKKFTGKPSPDQIIEAIKKSKIEPERIYYVGDMYVDYLLAKNSNAKFIFCKYGYERKKVKFKKSIKRFSDLMKIFKSKKIYLK